VIVSSGGVPVVLDFLLVDVQRLLDPQVIPALRPYEQKDRTGIFGTPGFMAPEQAEQGNVTVSTDIYGLGITLCHLFLPSQTSPEIAIKLDSNLPEFITKLLIDMTAAESDSRPKSMDEVVQRLGFQPKAKGMIQKWFTAIGRG
jgi:serine/threonine protein kinase